jgi:hypothetical protein
MEIKLKCSDYTKKINFKEAVKNVFDFNIGTALTEVVGIAQSKEMKAFLLLFNTFKTTNTQLKQELGQEILDSTTGLSAISSEFEIAIKNYFEQEITITKDFFQDVIKYNSDYIKKSFLLFKQNLEILKIEIPKNFEFDYYSAYRHNLQLEFQDNKDSYTELVDFFNNPIYDQNRVLNRQLKHYKDIKNFFTNQLQSDIPDSSESLQDLYIDPYFEFYKNNTIIENDEQGYNQTDFQLPIKEISIHTFLDNYFFKGLKHEDLRENYNMLFLLGQPGQGKTSFCYKLIYDYLESNHSLPETPIYFIKIRELIAKDFIENPFSTINKKLGQNIKFEEDNCCLILDGLDEAYMAGGLNDNDLKNLYDRINKTAQQNDNLKVILTSRLNYLKVNDPCLDKSLICQLSVLTDDQIREYTSKHKKFYPNNCFLNKVDEILENDEYIHIKELLQQAVLIYFISIADINIEEKDSKANIYDKIFDSLAKRSWDKQSGQLDYIKQNIKNNYKLYAKHLRTYIKNIAFEIYQSPNLYITLDKLSELQSTKNFISKCFNEDLFNSKEDIKEINKYLLISFYFQESNNNKTTETAIEFFHNSLWEYLTAEYMWDMNKNLLLKKDDDDEYENVIKEVYFNLLNDLTGQKDFSYAIKENLSYIIKNEKDEIKEAIFNQSIKIFYKLSEDDFLLEYSRKNNKLSAIEKAVSIFDLFWSYLFFCNIELNHKISTNLTINRFLLVFSRYLTRDYINIIFEDDLSLLNEIIHFRIQNSEFIESDDINYLIDCNINTCTFRYCSFLHAKIHENTFNNVIFIDCVFYRNNAIEGNDFQNMKFINVEVDSEDWLENLFNQNIVDENTKSNHEIEIILERNSRDIEEKKYFIRYNEK